jgi:membrane protein required for colicin V production
MTFSGATIYDLVVIGLFLLFVGRGLYLGLLKQVTVLLALYFAFFAAGRYHDRILPLLKEISTNSQLVFLVSYVVIFLVTYVLVVLLGKGLSYVLKLTITAWFDSLLGGVVGVAKAAIVVVLLHLILGAVFPAESPTLKTCYTCGPLNQAAEVTRELIRNEELRREMMQTKPAAALDAVKQYLAPANPPDKEAASPRP